MAKRLFRSSEQRVLAGICGGLGEYFDLDPVLVRLLAVIGLFASYGTAIIIYLIAWIIIPRRSLEAGGEVDPIEEPTVKHPSDQKWHSLLPGLILVGIGGLLLLREYVSWFGFGHIWPVFLILGGAGLILYGVMKHNRSFESNVNEQMSNGYNGGSGK